MNIHKENIITKQFKLKVTQYIEINLGLIIDLFVKVKTIMLNPQVLDYLWLTCKGDILGGIIQGPYNIDHLIDNTLVNSCSQSVVYPFS